MGNYSVNSHLDVDIKLLLAVIIDHCSIPAMVDHTDGAKLNMAQCDIA